jgi:ABC-2 type transport system ATP-binding protein
MIEVRNISKRFGKTLAVDDVSFTTEKEIFGFLGPNGAGKTTTIRIMTGITIPEGGSVRLCGHDIRENPVEAKKVFGLVPDPPYLYSYLKLREYLYFIGRLRKMDRKMIRNRIALLEDLFDLNNLSNRIIKGFSHGEQQLAALSGALLHDPDILILDEPLSGLDPGNAHLIKKILLNLAERGKTIFLSTHRLETVENLCTKVGIISMGKLVALESVSDLKEKSSDKSLEAIFLEITGLHDRVDSVSSILGKLEATDG